MSKKNTNIYLQRLNSFSKEVEYKYNCISLFSGGGGLDLGAHFAGFKTLLVSDIIPSYTETIKANLPHVSVYNDDAMDLSTEKIKGLAKIDGDVDLIIAGPPCQAFSIMGKRKSLDDPRGRLTIKYFELVSGLRPKVFLFENVPGLMTVNHGEDFNSLLKFIENETNYQLYRTKLNASDFGIPQERERIFIVGFRTDISCESFSFPTKATGSLHERLPDKMPSKYALENVEGLPNQVIRVHTEAVRKRFEAVPQGGRDRGSYSDRLRPDLPSGTVMIGSSAGGARPFIHPYEPRALTVRETARLQSFPDWYEFFGSRTEQYRQVGNAVPPLLAYEILSAIKKVLEGQNVSIPYEGLSWPITQHAGVLKAEVFDGLLNACLLCKGDTINAEKINEYLVNNGILTANVRADSNQVDAWRDYQQILSEFGLIYSTRISKVLTLTPVAMAYLNHSLSYSELITLQLLRYQYPNGHKSQLSPSLMQSYGKNFNYGSFTELQAHYNIQLRPAALIWRILYTLWESGEQPILSLHEMQGYAVRCTVMSDYLPCTESIIESRHDGQQLQPLTRARRNMADWMKLLSQTLLFNISGDGNTIALSTYSIKERKAADYVCSHLSDSSSFWEYKKDNYKQDWFDFYGDYDNSIEYILKENK